jgi:hypothetical protein
VEGRKWPSRWAGQRGAGLILSTLFLGGVICGTDEASEVVGRRTTLFFRRRYLRDGRSDRGSWTKDETEHAGGGIRNTFILFK